MLSSAQREVGDDKYSVEAGRTNGEGESSVEVGERGREKSFSESLDMEVPIG